MRPVVAVLGGGQLGRMLGMAAAPLGVGIRFLDPSPDANAGRLGPLTVAPLDDEPAITAFARGASVVTYEWEGVPAASAEAAEAEAPARPLPRALEVAQDRLTEKQTFERLGIGVARFAAVDDVVSLTAAVEAIGLPAILKTRRGGYDGKGQHVLRTAGDLDPVSSELHVPMILEGMVAFTRELSVLAARGVDGTTRCWPLVENEHRDGILRVSRAPARSLDDELQAAGERLAAALLDDLEYVGVLAVELFEQDGALLANEIAPRVHNSGHWTIEGAVTSQFEQHLRAVLGWPLGSPAPRGFAAMVNCIGAMPETERLLALDGVHVHDYEKEPRRGRKVGHVTITTATESERDDLVGKVCALVDAVADG